MAKPGKIKIKATVESERLRPGEKIVSSKPKIIQIAPLFVPNAGVELYALADDGKIYYKKNRFWVEVEGLEESEKL